MSQETALWLLAFIVAVAYALYPALMIRVIGWLLGSIVSLLGDAAALLLAWF